MQKTLFISDLHLDENAPEITFQFLQLLKQCDKSIDALYILGDLFEAWIGDDHDTPFHRSIIQALRAASDKGLKIYFMYGNRDFLIGKKFLQASGCKLLADEEKISLYGTPVLLMHGDTLCTKDLAYLKARKKGRNWLYQTIFLWMPLSYRLNFAERMRQKSAAYKKTATIEIMDVTQEEVERVMQKHRVQFLIHGHTHRPAFHPLKIDGESAIRIVLPAWHGRGKALVWKENGDYNFSELENIL